MIKSRHRPVAIKLTRSSMLAATLIAVSASAQTGPLVAGDGSARAERSPEQVESGEILVTARRVEERLQDVPVAITAFSGQQLKEKNAVLLSDVGPLTSGFTILPAPSNSTALTLAIRGQVQGEILATVEPSVGTYVDEMYWGRAYGLNSGLLDISNVQVLKGPQGTLFGRNTTGGALLVRSNDPSFDDFSGSASMTYGRFNEATGELVLNAPVSDMIALRGAVRISRRDGWAVGVRQFDPATNLPANGIITNGEIRPTSVRLDRRESIQGRLKLSVRPTDGVELLLSGEWFDFEGNGPAKQLVYKVNNDTASDNVAVRTPVLAYAAYFAEHPNAVGYDGFDCRFAVTQPALRCEDNLRSRSEVFLKLHTQTYVAKLSVENPLGLFKLISGYRSVVDDNLSDIDGSSTIMHAATLRQDLEQYSFEAQLTGETLGEKLSYAVGATYFTESGTDLSFSLTGNPAGDRPANATRNFGDIDNKSYGVYGQVNYKITDVLRITGGLRYSRDRKGIEVRSANVNLAGVPTGLAPGPYVLGTFTDPCNAAGAGTISGATPAGDCAASRADTFENVSWLVGVDYTIHTDVLLYAKTSRGYRSGGHNLRAFNDAQFVPFQPETVNEQEVGIKSELLDRRAIVNVATYHNIIKGAQRAILQTSGAGTNNTVISNAAKVRNLGVEADITVRPMTGLTVSGSASYNRSKYLEHVDALGDRSNDRFTLLPRTILTLAGTYDTRLSRTVSLVVGFDYNWTGKINSDRCTVTGISACYNGPPDRTGQSAAAISQTLFDLSQQASAGILNARAVFGVADDRYRLSFWGRNITDNRSYVNHVLLLAARRNYLNGIRRDPATYGMTVSATF